MIYKKPSVYGFQRNRISTEILSFLDSLPAEFEIVQPGMTQVRWPSDCTKGHLEIAARNLSYNAETSEGAAKHMLRALAAIAPEEKKRQYVMCYRKECGPFANVVAKEYPLGMEADKWKVVGGPYDIDTCVAGEPPVEKRKRKVWLWEKDHPHYTERSWTSNDIDRPGSGWRKVGECEVTE